MAPKSQPKQNQKNDPKQQEAQRLAEEAKKQEEEKKKLEEQKKFQVVVLGTGLELILTEWCIQEAWKNANPKQFLVDFMQKYFKKEKLLNNFESMEISIIAEFHLYNLIFCHEELHLDDFSTTVLLNIFWQLLRFNNKSYYTKTIDGDDFINEKDQLIEQQQQQQKSGKNKQNSVKNLESDFENFKQVLLVHCQENPPNNLKYFDANQVKKILDYVNIGYFDHYNLYKYVFDNQQKNEEIKMTVYVDIPLEVLPLQQALYIGKDKVEVRDDEEDYRQQAEEKIRKQEEARQAYFEQQEQMLQQQRLMEQEQLDPQTQEMINEKIEDARKYLNQQLHERQKQLEEKLEQLVPNKGQKKK